VDKENVAYIHNKRSLFSHKDEDIYGACRKMDGSRDHRVTQNKAGSEGQRSHVLSHTESRTNMYI
jgi:hypothetical protein